MTNTQIITKIKNICKNYPGTLKKDMIKQFNINSLNYKIIFDTLKKDGVVFAKYKKSKDTSLFERLSTQVFEKWGDNLVYDKIPSRRTTKLNYATGGDMELTEEMFTSPSPNSSNLLRDEAYSLPTDEVYPKPKLTFDNYIQQVKTKTKAEQERIRIAEVKSKGLSNGKLNDGTISTVPNSYGWMDKYFDSKINVVVSNSNLDEKIEDVPTDNISIKDKYSTDSRLDISQQDMDDYSF
jgi:hypothetical protein